MHDWLYTYIYKDFYENVFVGNKVASKLAVFFISAVFHEYIITFTLQFFFPVLFCQFFIFGVLFTFVNKETSAGNIFMWITLELGYSMFLSLYSIELNARSNCQQEITSLNYFVPVFLTCNCFN